MKRKWLPNFGELIDRLSIHQIKEVKIPEHKDKYRKEMKDICHDIDLLIKEKKISFNSDLVRTIIIISQINLHIWYNEKNARNGSLTESDLFLTHGLNGIRNRAQNFILEIIKETERKEYKTDCLAEEHQQWDIDFLRKYNDKTPFRLEKKTQNKTKNSKKKETRTCHSTTTQKDPKSSK